MKLKIEFIKWIKIYFELLYYLIINGKITPLGEILMTNKKFTIYTSIRNSVYSMGLVEITELVKRAKELNNGFASNNRSWINVWCC